MLDHPTHDQLRELKLDGMADAFAELQGRDDVADLGHAEWLGLLIDRETASRSTKTFQTRMRAAKLRHVGALHSRMWTSEHRADSTRRCSRSSPPANGSGSTKIC